MKGVNIGGDINSLRFINNIAKNGPILKKDSLFKILKHYNVSRNHHSFTLSKQNITYPFNFKPFSSHFDSLITKDQLTVLEKKYDSLNIIYNRFPSMRIDNANFKNVRKRVLIYFWPVPPW